jgi:hypothetical protein
MTGEIGGPLHLVNAAVNYPNLGIHTIAVSFDIGMQSQFRKAIIVDGARDEESWRQSGPSKQLAVSSKVLVHTTPSLLATGYHIGACEGLPYGVRRVYSHVVYTTWNSETMVLHLQDLDEKMALLYFDLVARSSEPYDLTLTLQPVSGEYMVRKR